MTVEPNGSRVAAYKQMKACRDIFLESFYNLKDTTNAVTTKDHLAVLLAEGTIIKGFLRELLNNKDEQDQR